MNTLTTLTRYVRSQFVNDLKVSLEMAVLDGTLILEGYKNGFKIFVGIFIDKVIMSENPH
jgi:hypothetical protein